MELDTKFRVKSSYPKYRAQFPGSRGIQDRDNFGHLTSTTANRDVIDHECPDERS